MNYLDIVARLICLGGLVFVAVWIWSILSAPENLRPCVGCGGRLSTYDLAHCYKCLGGSNA